MNKRQKIIVSIVGITIVLLALLGITYAYYLTRIEGNTNTNSISITTADLKLVYGDGTTNILTKENIVPDNNNPVGTKDFTVTNTGNTTIDNYSVVLEYAVIDGVTPSVFKYPNDFEITLTCIDNEGNACNGTKINFNNEAVTLTTASIDPNEIHNYTLEIYYRDSGIDQSDDMGKNLNLKVQIYEVGETTDINGTITGVDENYIVKLTSKPKISPVVKTSDGSYSYAFSGVEIGTHTLRVLNKDGVEVSNQKIVVQKGDDIGFSTTEVDDATVPLITVNKEKRVISLTTNVNTTNSTITNSGTSVSTFNPYESNKNSLAYNILNKAIVAKNNNSLTETIYESIPLTKPAEEENREDEKILSVIQDDYGTSYYYRGYVEDNYVNFAEMCWRIVRIEGDGSIKLILEDRYAKCNDTEDIDGIGTIDYAYTGNWSGGEDDYYEFGYDDSYRADFLNYSGGLADSFKIFQTSKLSSYLGRLKVDEWCYDDVVTDYWYGDGETSEYYGAYTRVYKNKKPSLKCAGTKLTKYKENIDMYVGTLTADEMSFAGATFSAIRNHHYYLMNNNVLWLSLSPSTFYSDGVSWALCNNNGILVDDYITCEVGASRPAVVLKSSTTFAQGGEGTKSNPYVIG